MSEQQWNKVGWLLIAIFFVIGMQDPEFLPMFMVFAFPALLLWAALRDPTK